MRVFLDANVVFSAAITPDGRSSVLLELASDDPHDAVASEHVVVEARRNVSVRYPHALDRLESVVLPDIRVVPEADLATVSWASRYGLPPDDAPVLAAASTCGADVLVTGDRRHFGPLFGRTLNGVVVLTLKDAIDWLLTH